MAIIANTPGLKSWLEIKADSDFPLQNIPFGIAKLKNGENHVCTRIGDFVIALGGLNKHRLFRQNFNEKVFLNTYLNDFIELGKEITSEVRNKIAELFEINSPLKNDNNKHSDFLYKITEVEMQMPVKVGDYTDFYSSMDHATNVGKMFRDPENALLPNWKHLPVGYHGRASSICVSGHSFHRPKGQSKPADAEAPVFGPSKLLDFELETAFIIGKSTKMGDTISTVNAQEYIFGMVLFNDWSARDIQAWEYVPLGPFLAKNFASTVSPWVVTMEALEPFRVKGYEQSPKVLPYLEYSGDKNIDIELNVFIQPEGGEENLVCESNYRYMYWTMEQQLAHHTVNGCNVNIGDMMASGTISGPKENQFGSMLEITWRGSKPIKLKDGSERKFINDNDWVIIRGHCENKDYRIGFGECKSKALAAK